MTFALSPGPLRSRVRELVEQGGGVLVDPRERDSDDDRILLADKDLLQNRTFVPGTRGEHFWTLIQLVGREFARLLIKKSFVA